MLLSVIFDIVKRFKNKVKNENKGPRLFTFYKYCWFSFG